MFHLGEMVQLHHGRDAKGTRITQTVKDCVGGCVTAGGGYVVTVATIQDAMGMMTAVNDMATITGGVFWHLKYYCVKFPSTVELMQLLFIVEVMLL